MRPAIFGLALALGGCWLAPTCPQVSTPDILTKCRSEARSAFDAGASAAASEAVYERCKLREGLTP